MRIISSVAASAAAILVAAAPAGAAPTNYPGVQSTIKYTTATTAGACGSATAKACGFGNYTRATSKVVYDPATDTYTVRDTGSLTTTSSFAPANILSSNTTYTTYQKVSGSTTETLRILTTAGVNPLIELSYVNYGRWRRSTAGTNTTSVNDTYVVFGTKSPSSAVTSGTGTYTTALDGTFVNKTGGAYDVAGTGTMGADFGAGTITYSSTATGTPQAGGAALAFGTLTGSGQVAVNSAGFSGIGVTNGSGYRMDVNGFFYGPAAQEVGGTFRLTGNGGNGTGAIVGN
jgi:hypothetical protein